MSAVEHAFLFGLFAGIAIGFPAGVLAIFSTRRKRNRFDGARLECDLDLAPAEFRSER